MLFEPTSFRRRSRVRGDIISIDLYKYRLISFTGNDKEDREGREGSERGDADAALRHERR